MGNLVGADFSVTNAFASSLQQLWARDRIGVDDPAAVAKSVAESFASGAEGARAASDLLTRSGVREQWNNVLRLERARSLAARVKPLAIEPLLDVLSGDGSVCRALSELGVATLAATERSGDYPESLLPSSVAFRSFDDDLDLTQFNASSALLSTVLHHEPDPVALLNLVARAAIPRWIVIENCVTSNFSPAFHQLADRFFNNCLNEFGADCVDQHRTIDGWVDLLTSYGDVAAVEESFTVPGIPFPYTLFIVTTPAR